MAVALVWFRQDLRLTDNPALSSALRDGYAVVPVYIHAPSEAAPWQPGAASNAWLHRSLAALEADLSRRGSLLVIQQGESLVQLQAIATATGAQAVYWNRLPEPALSRRDALIERALRKEGLLVQTFNGDQLIEPDSVLTGQGTPYKVFTPWWKATLPRLQIPPANDPPVRFPVIADVRHLSARLDALALQPDRSWDKDFWELHLPGEAGASDTLTTFVEGALQGYTTQRDLPDRVGTSLLSPHLHFGEISPWTVLRAVRTARTAANTPDCDALVRQVGWREFSRYTLHHVPQLSESPLNPRYQRMKRPPTDPSLLAAWQQGRTGVPIVDAGMRQLLQQGWMHNRVRMITASWLCKHLRMHWTIGARWFWDTLVDADLANNSLGWQWVAGSGSDASPFFRIFNPVSQAQKFDPDARYITRWVPELGALAPSQRFAPWLHGGAPGYPAYPQIDIGAGREAALRAWRGS